MLRGVTYYRERIMQGSRGGWHYSGTEDGGVLAWLGSVLLDFLKASVSMRKSVRASIPFTVPKISVMTRSSEAERSRSRVGS